MRLRPRNHGLASCRRWMRTSSSDDRNGHWLHATSGDMSTRKTTVSDEMDELEKAAREVPADRGSSARGPKVLRERLRQAAQRKTQVTIRLDTDIVERFKE